MVSDNGDGATDRSPFQVKKVMIRLADQTDGERCAEIFLTARRKAFAWQPGELFDLKDYHDSVEGEAVWIAEVAGHIVGFISVCLTENMIHNLFIDPVWQNRGIGSQLLDHALGHMTGPAHLRCVVRNESARAFYRRKGWIEQPDASDDEPYILYRKA